MHSINNGLDSSSASISGKGPKGLLSGTDHKIKFDVNNVKSLSITSDQKFILFGVMRKILFIDIKEIYKCKRKVRENKFDELSSLKYSEFQQVECNPIYPYCVASLSDTVALVWDLQMKKEPVLLYYLLISWHVIG